MLRFLLLVLIMAVPLCTVMFYAFFILCTTAPISELSIEKAGQFGDSFGVINSLFSGFAFSGILITLMFQRDELKLQRQQIEQSKNEQAKNEKLNALAALLSVYHELADKKQAELESPRVPIPGETGQVEEKLRGELESILRMRNKIFDELEKSAGL